ncbi:MAG: RNA polymerase sigma factor FliA [Myxococcota bacterium]|nr:RNA polymerase sigma factor FliA [Myxococcota bacterium]
MANTARITKQDRDRLILKYYPMVRRVAYRMVTRYPSCIEADDLVAIGTLGLIDAVDRFEESRTLSFAAYARIRVQGAILDELRKSDWVPRSVRNRNTRILEAKQSLTEQLGREPLHEELAKHLEISEERLSSLIQGATVRTLVSMEEGKVDDETIGKSLQSEEPTPLEAATRTHLRTVVRGHVSTLPERERQIVEMYYFQELTFREIGEILGITESRVSQLHSRMKRRLSSTLNEVLEQ